MEALYQQYFGLREAPFNISPDPDFLFLSASHREALAQISYGINGRKGFIVLTGEVGTGKTTLIRSLLNQVGANTYTALIFNNVASARDLMRYICEDFGIAGVKSYRQDIHDYVVSLNEFLLEKYQGGENCALIIDEAQNLSLDVLESVRLLSNFETSKDKLLQILLVGQPELSDRLNSSDLRQLKQRVTLRYRLRNLGLTETGEYIGNRLKIAGGDPAVFTVKSVETIYAYSNGIPRVINVLCDNGLLTAFALGRRVVDTSMIREVAEDLNLYEAPSEDSNGNGRTKSPNGYVSSNKGDGNDTFHLENRPVQKTFISRIASRWRAAMR